MFLLAFTISILAASGLQVLALSPARFPCTSITAGIAGPSDALCVGLSSGGTGLGGNYKSNYPVPVGAQCVLSSTNEYSCGWQGAACNPQLSGALTSCDSGACIGTSGPSSFTGTCQGNFGYNCGGLDSHCLGLLYCTSTSNAQTADDTCGGAGSFCQDPSIVAGNTAAQAQALFSTTCASGYCNAGSAECDTLVAPGGSCAVDPVYGCSPGYTCVTKPDLTQVCQAFAVPSGRARARRNELAQRATACPSPLSACSVAGSRLGFECVNTQSNLELCGGCRENGGDDCTSIPNAGTIQCSQGKCVVSSCEANYTLDPWTNRCVL